MTTKTCSKCKVEKQLDCFSSNGKKGLNSHCKQCRTATELQRRKDNVDAYKEKDKAYHEKNKEERNAQAREYRKNNSETLNANAREKYQRNKDAVREYHQNRKEIRNAVKKKRMDNDPQARIKES